MGHLHIRIQRLQSTRDKPTDADLEDKIKKNIVFCTTKDPSKMKRGNFTQIYVNASPLDQIEEIYTSTSFMYMILIPS